MLAVSGGSEVCDGDGVGGRMELDDGGEERVGGRMGLDDGGEEKQESDHY